MIDQEQLLRIADAAEAASAMLKKTIQEMNRNLSVERADVEWPEADTLVWVRGKDAGRRVEGVGVRRLNSSSIDSLALDLTSGRWEWSIWRNSVGKADELFEATPLTTVPTAMLERLMAAGRDDVWDLREDLFAWVREHPQAGGHHV